MRAVADLAGILFPAARAVAATVVSLLPRRYWGRIDLPIAAAAMASGVLTFFAGAAIGIPAYLDFAQHMADAYTDAFLESAYRAMEGRGPALHGGVGSGVSALSLFAFLLTPTGALAGYLLVSGMGRFVADAAYDAQGDPLLTALDTGTRALVARVRRDRARAARERLEGPEVPDVLLRGEEGGVPEAELVVVASRRKDGWEKGVFVVTSECWYRIGQPFDRRFPDGLRRVYPISRVRDLEVIRRSVYYELPRLSAAGPAAPP